MKYNNLNDVMKHLTQLERCTSHNPINQDVYQIQIDTIGNMLELFGVKWRFVEKGEHFVAELLNK